MEKVSKEEMLVEVNHGISLIRYNLQLKFDLTDKEAIAYANKGIRDLIEEAKEQQEVMKMLRNEG